MATVGDLIQQTKAYLHGTYREELNTLSANITDSATSLTLSLGNQGIARGSYITIDDEIMYVTAISGSTVTVIRGHLGTAKAAHTAGALIEVNARFPKPLIRQALKEEILSWHDWLFKVAAIDVTAPATSTRLTSAVNITTTDLIEILEVRKKPETSDTSWPVVVSWEVLRDMPTGTFASGVALQVNEPLPTNKSLRVKYAQRFDLSAFSTDATTHTDIGLAESMLDIPPMGAAWRLLTAQEAQRTDILPRHVSAISDDHPPLNAMRASAGIKALRDIRLSEEAARLRNMYPVRRG